MRDVLVAGALGAGPIADAFVVAFRLPNVVRRLFAEGAFNTAFIPLYSEARARGEETAFTNQVFSMVAVTFAVATILVVIAMPLVLRIIAPGFSDDLETKDLATSLARIAFPYCLATALMAVAAGVLHAQGRFSAAAYVPSMLNAVLIAAVLLVQLLGWSGAETTAYALAWAILIGGLAQFFVAVLALKSTGTGLGLVRPTPSLRLRRFFLLALPGLAAASITQVNAFVALYIGSSEPGVVTWLHYADRIYQLPLGIVGVAIGIALLPDLAGHLAEGNRPGERHAFSRAVELAAFLSLPAAFGLMLAAKPIVAALFERGAFSPSDTHATAAALAAFSIGLPAFVAAKVLQPLFFARTQMRLPLLIAIAGAVCDVAVAIVLFPTFKQAGIAAAAAAAGWINAIGLGIAAWRQGLVGLDDAARRRLPRIALASVALACAAGFAAPYVSLWSEGLGDLARFVLVSGLACAAFALFAGLCVAIGGLDREAFREAFRKLDRSR